jgi:hypothetical protein
MQKKSVAQVGRESLFKPKKINQGNPEETQETKMPFWVGPKLHPPLIPT